MTTRIEPSSHFSPPLQLSGKGARRTPWIPALRPGKSVGESSAQHCKTAPSHPLRGLFSPTPPRNACRAAETSSGSAQSGLKRHRTRATPLRSSQLPHPIAPFRRPFRPRRGPFRSRARPASLRRGPAGARPARAQAPASSLGGRRPWPSGRRRRAGAASGAPPPSAAGCPSAPRDCRRGGPPGALSGRRRCRNSCQKRHFETWEMPFRPSNYVPITAKT